MIQILNGKANFIIIEEDKIEELGKTMILLDPKKYSGVKQGDIYDSETDTFSTPPEVILEEIITMKDVMDKIKGLEKKHDKMTTKIDSIKTKTDLM